MFLREWYLIEEVHLPSAGRSHSLEGKEKLTRLFPCEHWRAYF